MYINRFGINYQIGFPLRSATNTLEKKGFAYTQPIIFKDLQIIANERLPYGNIT